MVVIVSSSSSSSSSICMVPYYSITPVCSKIVKCPVGQVSTACAHCSSVFNFDPTGTGNILKCFFLMYFYG